MTEMQKGLSETLPTFRLLHWVDFGLIFGIGGNDVSLIHKQYIGRFAYFALFYPLTCYQN